MEAAQRRPKPVVEFGHRAMFTAAAALRALNSADLPASGGS